MVKKIIATIEDIETLSQEAKRGNLKSESRLKQINKTLSKRANERMRELRRAGYQTAAYTRLEDFITSTYGANAKGLRTSFSDIESLQENVEAAIKFLNWQTSTISGEKTRRQNIINTMQNRGLDITPDIQEDFLRFLESDAWAEFKHIDSGERLEEAVNALQNGATINQLEELFEKYKREQLDVFEVMDQWQEVGVNENPFSTDD